MRILILGGTAWLGQTIAQRALIQGHEVTCMARGSKGVAPAGAAFVRCDRDEADAYERLTHSPWDAVIDVGRQPGQVRRAAAALREVCASFVFVSSSSVYADKSTPGADESAALLPALKGDSMESMLTYGEAKVACELHVLEQFGPARSLIVRPGLIGGPGDISDRTGYWPLRFARPANELGLVLIPGVPGLATQIIDVRDLAEWIVESIGRKLSGVFNANGLAIPLMSYLQLAREVAGHRTATISVDQDWLLAHAITPWMGPRSMPLWVPLPAYAGFTTRDSNAARTAGLVTRRPETTLEDVLAWELDRSDGKLRQAGLSDDDERELLLELKSDGKDRR